MAERPIILLHVPDVAAEIENLTERFGWQIAQAPDARDLAELTSPHDTATRWILAGPAAENVEAVIGQPVAIYSSGRTVEMQVPDVEAYAEELLQRGVGVYEITETPWGDKTFTVTTPGGITFAFFSHPSTIQ